MFPARYAHILFSLILSGMMSCIVSGIATLRSLGVVQGFLGAWAGNWLSGWAVAFPAVMVLAPVSRKIVARLTKG